MAFTYIPVTGTWTGHTGKVVVTALRAMTNSGHTVSTEPRTYTLDGSGSVGFNLAATDDPDTTNPGAYEFYLEISGQDPQTFSTVIPRAQVGGLNISQLPWGAIPSQPSAYAPATASLYDGYASKGTEALGKADSGQSWNVIDNGQTGAGLSIISGALTNTSTVNTTAAGYMQTQLPNPVTRVAAAIKFSSGATTGGNATMGAWASKLTNLSAIPDSDAHVVITPTGWQWGIWRSNVYTVIASGSWAQGFAWGANFRSVQVVIASGWGRIIGPDGNSYLVTDSRIGPTAGEWAFFEVYQNNASTDPKASFLTVTADDADVSGYKGSGVGFADLASALTQKPSATALAYGTTETLTFPTADAPLDSANLALDLIAGPTGATVIDVSGFFFWNNTSGSTQTAYVAVTIGGTQYATTEIASFATGTSDSRALSRKLVVTGLTPGQSYTATLVGHCTASNTFQLLINGSLGQFAVMQATPC